MKVDLISKPDNLKKLIYTACRTCYSKEEPIEIFNGEYTDAEMTKLISKVMESGHLSTVEHISFSFAISGITRKTSHQIVRTRHSSFSQKSQRYVTYHQPFGYNIPDSINPNKHYLIDRHGAHDIGVTYTQLMDIIQQMYTQMIEEGIPAEDARDMFPNACHTDMVWTINLRSLMHTANERLCTNAQKEYRQLMQKMCGLVVKEYPFLKDFLVPKCEVFGYCKEIKSCGRRYKREDVI